MENWRETIKTTLDNLGGQAHLEDIYDEVKRIRTDLSDNFDATVRRTLEQNSSDCDSYTGKYDLFELREKGSGYWRLREPSRSIKKCEYLLVICFFLSRFKSNGIKSLGYNNLEDAYDKISAALLRSPKSIKNLYEEFNLINLNPNKFSPKIKNIVLRYENLSEIALRNLVLKIIKNKSVEIINNNETESDDKHSYNFTTRGKTGEAAENYFKENWKKYFSEYKNCEDTTKNGCGYDFLLTNANVDKSLKIEVKGAKDSLSGISLTDKEWAEINISENKNNYVIFFVYDLDNKPKSLIIKDPTKLKPEQYNRETITTTWSVSKKDLNHLINNN